MCVAKLGEDLKKHVGFVETKELNNMTRLQTLEALARDVSPSAPWGEAAEVHYRTSSSTRTTESS